MNVLIAGIGVLCGGCGFFIGVVAWMTYLDMRDEREAFIRQFGE